MRVLIEVTKLLFTSEIPYFFLTVQQAKQTPNILRVMHNQIKTVLAEKENVLLTLRYMFTVLDSQAIMSSRVMGKNCNTTNSYF